MTHIVELIEDGEDLILPLPEEILKQLGWEMGDVLEISVDDSNIILSKKE